MISENFFEHLKAHYNNSLPFVVYRKPDEKLIKALLQQTNHLYFSKDFSETGFVFSPFDDVKKTVLLPLELSDSLEVCVEDKETNVEKTFLERNYLNNNLKIKEEKEYHINLVKQGLETIHNNIFNKVVLSRKEKIPLTDSNPFKIFKKLLAKYKSAFVYCWYHPKIGLWLGATPEALIKKEGKSFSIMALAGTQNYKGNVDVVWQDKEKEEQHIVTNFIVENLHPLVSQIKTSETKTVKSGNLLHLKTMISARLHSHSNLQDIISVLHPTPAVCGVPKKAAKQFILEQEGYNREFYTGFLGELNFKIVKAPRMGKRNIENKAYSITKKSTQLYVNLRCMQIQNSKAFIYVGGGITESSIPESEWEETVHKSMVIKNVL